MYTNSILAITGALVAAVAAVPRAEFQHHHQHHQHQAPNKRDLVWVTKYEEVIETLAVTKTVWVKPGDSAPTGSSYSDGVPVDVQPAAKPAPAASSAPVAAAYVPPVSSEPAAATVAPSAPAYVAPAPSSAAPAAESAPAPAPYVAPAAESAPAPASTYIAPAPYVAPEQPSSAAAPAPAASSASPSYGSGSGSGSSGEEHSGDLTYYAVGLGACGFDSVDTDDVIAISHVLFDAVSTGNPNTNPLCKQKITIIGADGQPHVGTIVDRCPGCDADSLDLSEPFFNKVTSNGNGRVHNFKWSMGG